MKTNYKILTLILSFMLLIGATALSYGQNCTAPISLPWNEGFENNSGTYTDSNTNVGNCWSYNESNKGRLRFDEISRTGNRAILFDVSQNNNQTQNYILKTLNLSNYINSNDLNLSFWVLDQGDESNNGDAVWIRGNDNAVWIKAVQLTPQSYTDGQWQLISGIDIDEILSSEEQSVSSTFQIRLGQYDNYQYDNDGIAFDDIQITGTVGTGGNNPNQPQDLFFETFNESNNAISGNGDGFNSTNNIPWDLTDDNPSNDQDYKFKVDGGNDELDVQLINGLASWQTTGYINIEGFTNLEFSFMFDKFEIDRDESATDYVEAFYLLNGETEPVPIQKLERGSQEDVQYTESLNIPDTATSIKLIVKFNHTDSNSEHEVAEIKLTGVPYANVWQGVDAEGENIEDEELWSSGVVPDSTSTIMIGSGKHLRIKNDVTFKTVIVNTGALLTIDKTGSLTTVEDFVNKGTDNVNMWSDHNKFSSLIVNGTSTGAVNYNRWVNNYEVGTNGNDCISSPVAGDTWQNVMSNNTDVLYNNGTLFSFTPYINGGNGWGNFYTNTTTANITSGIGYRVATFANASAPIKFTGTVLNSDVTVPLNRAQTRWNVVGNPYTSYINLSEFLTENINELDTDYVVVLGYNGVNNTDGWIYYNLSSAIESNVTIAPGQGFYLAAKTNSSVVTFKPSMRTYVGEDDFLQNGMRNAEQTVQKMRLNVAKGNQARHSELYFLDYNGVSDDFDLGFDSYVYNGSDSFNIYSTLVNNTTNTDKLAIQSMTMENVLESVIALGVHAQAGQQITFSIDQVTTGEETLVYLEDRATDTWTLLNDGNTFTVTPNTNLTGTGRFYLHLQDEGRLSTTEFNADLNQVGIKSINGTKQLVITGELAEDTQVSIYDMTGKLVLNNTIKAFNQTNRINVAQINTGVYVVSLKNNSQSVSKQVLIN